MQRVRSVHESIKRLQDGVILTTVLVFIIEKKEKKNGNTPHTTTHIGSMDVYVYTSNNKKRKNRGGKGFDELIYRVAGRKKGQSYSLRCTKAF